MSIDVATVAGEYLPAVGRLSDLLKVALNKPVSRSELDAILVALPPDGRVASSGVFREAIQKLGEVIQYEYVLRDEIDAAPQVIENVGREAEQILGAILKTKPSPHILLDAPGVLDRYFWALSTFGELIVQIAFLEYSRIKNPIRIRDHVLRVVQKLESCENGLKNGSRFNRTPGKFRLPRHRDGGNRVGMRLPLRKVRPKLSEAGCGSQPNTCREDRSRRQRPMMHSFLTHLKLRTSSDHSLPNSARWGLRFGTTNLS